MKKCIYVLDTSVFLTNANSVYSYEDNNIIVPMKVLEEIDKHKKRQDSVGSNARTIIRIFDDLREVGSLYNGVSLGDKKGILTVRPSALDVHAYLPDDLSPDVPDHKIIATAMQEREKSPENDVILVSRDVNMRVICDALGLPTEDYNPDQVLESGEEVYTGFSEVLVDDDIIDRFYAADPIELSEQQSENIHPNQFVMLKSNINDSRTALTRYNGKVEPLRMLSKRKNFFGISPRNREQSFAMDLLFDKSIPVVSLLGSAGTGKTLCALSAGLEQVLQTEDYTRLIVSRPIQPLGKDIGFLPGTMEEKMAPWLTPIQDNLQFLMGNDKLMLQEYLDRGTIEMEAITYIRGRSISKAFIIIDEAQNLTRHELKTIVTRIGEDSKLILTGDIEQIDNVYVDETSNGLTYAVEKFKEHNLAGHVSFLKGERSAVATLAAKIL
jgi:PhoH-like ATPase